jgi:hypothetical protein
MACASSPVVTRDAQSLSSLKNIADPVHGFVHSSEVNGEPWIIMATVLRRRMSFAGPIDSAAVPNVSGARICPFRGCHHGMSWSLCPCSTIAVLNCRVHMISDSGQSLHCNDGNCVIWPPCFRGDGARDSERSTGTPIKVLFLVYNHASGLGEYLNTFGGLVFIPNWTRLRTYD